jgi:hypothetical protein
LYNKIILNDINDKFEREVHEIVINLKLDFTRGKKYNEKLVNDNPTSLDIEQKNDTIDP